MRKLLLSTVSVAALVTLAACSDEVADNTEKNPASFEQTAEVDTTIPTTDTVPEPVANADPAADLDEARRAIADARDAIRSQSEAAAVQALIDVERAIDDLAQPDDAQAAVDTARNEVVNGDFAAALAALSDVEIALDASAAIPASDETTASTTE